ncbi:hypothetical protein AwErysi_02600 [Erysipelotrichaceae bacterium]|nr:hypothetical protein AwErysi_02600 [Erysipelotrichaceae bacterium]
MRIDKFLKDSRLVKRRTIAKQLCDAKKIAVNDKKVKAGAEVKLADIITIEYAKMVLKVEIVSLKIELSKALASTCYEEVARVIKEDKTYDA